MKNAFTLGALIAVFSLSYSYGGSKTRSVNRAAPVIEDKSCELLRGSAECIAQRGKNSEKSAERR